MTSPDPRLAVLMLCCRDYEAVEVALACHMAYGDPKVPFFVLQNCRGDYDAERTLTALRRYETLYPDRIRVIERATGTYPYEAVAEALQSELLDYDYICKVDDDAFPIASGWLDALWQAYADARARLGDKLGYATPLINNNCWGFPETLKVMGLEKAYFAEAARPHRTGPGPTEARRRLAPANEVDGGEFGTIWKAPDIARWLHGKTTLQPDRFIEATRGLSAVPVDNTERYSIGCILFHRELWTAMNDGGDNDETMIYSHCREHALEITCARSVPYVHLTYYVQKDELRDVVRAASELYAKRTGVRHPISARASQLDELESRLRHIEKRMRVSAGLEMERPADGGLISMRPAAEAPTPAVPSAIAAMPAKVPAGKAEAVREDGGPLLATGDPMKAEGPEWEQAWAESAAFRAEKLGKALGCAAPDDALRACLALAPRGGLALEFGVYSGRTLAMIAEARAGGRVFGFDSFKGLPENWRKGFPAGYFATDKVPVVDGAELVVGLFDESLPVFLGEHDEHVDFVHVDCDLYSSTRTVLDLIGPRLRPGSIILFDEYYNFPTWQDHEHKAWMEFVARTGVKFEYLCYGAHSQQVGVRILHRTN